MSKTATKAADNMFYKARMAAATYNDRLNSREGASEIIGIDQRRIASIELGTVVPHPDEVLMMIDAYNAPELLNYYCSTLCPLGQGHIDRVEIHDLGMSSICLSHYVGELNNVVKTVFDALADGRLTNEEKREIMGKRDAIKRTRAVLDEFDLCLDKIGSPERGNQDV